MVLKFSLISVIVLILCCFSSSIGSQLDWKAHTKTYGEPCINHDQCVDFRMICPESQAICQCDQFHDWTELDTYTSECVLNVERLRSFLASQEERKPGVEEELSEQAHNLFVYLGLSGIIAISLGVLLVMACVLFVFTS